MEFIPWIILILLILLVIIALPVWPFSRGWGHFPATIGAVLLAIVIIMLLLGWLPFYTSPSPTE